MFAWLHPGAALATGAWGALPARAVVEWCLPGGRVPLENISCVRATAQALAYHHAEIRPVNRIQLVPVVVDALRPAEVAQ